MLLPTKVSGPPCNERWAMCVGFIWHNDQMKTFDCTSFRLGTLLVLNSSSGVFMPLWKILTNYWPTHWHIILVRLSITLRTTLLGLSAVLGSVVTYIAEERNQSYYIRAHSHAIRVTTAWMWRYDVTVFITWPAFGLWIPAPVFFCNAVGGIQPNSSPSIKPNSACVTGLMILGDVCLLAVPTVYSLSVTLPSNLAPPQQLLIDSVLRVALLTYRLHTCNCKYENAY